MSNGGFVMGIGIQIGWFDCLEKGMHNLKVVVFMNGLFWLVHSVRFKVNYNIIHLKIAMIIGCGVNIMQNFGRKQSMNRANVSDEPPQFFIRYFDGFVVIY
jgi:hypothetical protein